MTDPSLSDERLASLEAQLATDAPSVASALASLDLRAVGGAVRLVRVARLCEEVGDLDRAILAYNLSLKADPSQPEVLWRLAQLRLDLGDVQRAARCLARLTEVSPGDARARELLATTLEQTGAHGAAASVRGSAELQGGAGERDDVLAPSDAHCIVFCSLFSGREAVHARQWASATGKGGYSPVHEPFTPGVARRHLMGDVTVGVYPLRSDSTVRWLCLDVDITAAALSQAKGAAVRRLLSMAHQTACKLLDACARHELACLLEDSGNKGRHVWLLLAEPVPAAAVRRVGDLLVGEVDEVPPEIKVEVFPKQARVPSDGLGNLVKLPLGIHRVTGRRCWLLDAKGEPIERPLDLLDHAPRVPRARLMAALAGRELAPSVGDSASAGEPNEGVSLAPVAPPYTLEADREASWLLSRCAVLSDVVTRAASTHLLTNDERTVLTFTMGHLPEGARAVNHVLARALNVEPQAMLKSALRGNPMSCPKIRAKLPVICARVGCDCVFDAPASYPHPLLHLDAIRARRLEGDEPTLLDIERLVLDLRKVMGDLGRLEAARVEIEKRLTALVEARGPLVTAAGSVTVVGGRLVLEAAKPPGGEG